MTRKTFFKSALALATSVFVSFGNLSSFAQSKPSSKDSSHTIEKTDDISKKDQNGENSDRIKKQKARMEIFDPNKKVAHKKRTDGK